MKHIYTIGIILFAVLFLSTTCSQKTDYSISSQQPVYKDIPYQQDYAVKYRFDEVDLKLEKVYSDRNSVIQILTSKGLYRTDNGHFQYPGTLKKDKSYMPMADKKIADMLVYQGQFVYLDDAAVFSNARAGKIYSRHQMKNAKILCGGDAFTFLVSYGKTCH